MNEHILEPKTVYLCRRCLDEISFKSSEIYAEMCALCHDERIRDLKSCDTCNKDERDSIGTVKGFAWCEDEQFKGQYFLREMK